ncbi:porin [Aeromonas veronii]|uniref:porin n=1 Tax=Aeromonas veronii TaxID=654 RepID=UPI0038DB353D
MLALILPALLGTGSAHAAVIYQADDGSNVDLYGRLGFNISDKKSGNDQGDFDGRIGFTARQTVNDDVAVIGMAQYQVNAAEYANNVQKNSSDLTARYVWAGIDAGQWGKVTGGRVSSGLIMFTDIGDVFAASDVSMARQASKVDSTAVQVFRQDGTLQYQNTLGNLDLSLAYILGNGTRILITATTAPCATPSIWAMPVNWLRSWHISRPKPPRAVAARSIPMPMSIASPGSVPATISAL